MSAVQARFLKRQLSLPVSTISQWLVRRSKAVVILGSPKTVGHSPKAQGKRARWLQCTKTSRRGPRRRRQAAKGGPRGPSSARGSREPCRCAACRCSAAAGRAFRQRPRRARPPEAPEARQAHAAEVPGTGSGRSRPGRPGRILYGLNSRMRPRSRANSRSTSPMVRNRSGSSHPSAVNASRNDDPSRARQSKYHSLRSAAANSAARSSGGRRAAPQIVVVGRLHSESPAAQGWAAGPYLAQKLPRTTWPHRDNSAQVGGA
jgi:hypothetical protein